MPFQENFCVCHGIAQQESASIFGGTPKASGVAAVLERKMESRLSVLQAAARALLSSSEATLPRWDRVQKRKGDAAPGSLGDFAATVLGKEWKQPCCTDPFTLWET